jgi:hypothetical protein
VVVAAIVANPPTTKATEPAKPPNTARSAPGARPSRDAMRGEF